MTNINNEELKIIEKKTIELLETAKPREWSVLVHHLFRVRLKMIADRYGWCREERRVPK